MEKNTYRTFCAQAPVDFPVFMQDWYLDAVCAGGDWEAVVVEKGGEVRGVMPYFVKQRMGRRYVVMPPLCRQMGPYLMPEYRSAQKAVGILEALEAGLPRLASFEQDFNYTADNWLPFYFKGYRQTTRYSYRLPLHDLDAVWQGIKPDYRNNKIKKAQRLVRVGTDADADAFLRVHDLSFVRQGLTPPVSAGFFRGLDAVLEDRGARTQFFAVDRDSGVVHAVAYLIWDRQTAWYLMSGDDPALRQSGAGMLLIWECMRYAAETLRLPWFDFAGSMLPPVEHVRRHFGAQPHPYFRVWRDRHLLWKIKRLV